MVERVAQAIHKNDGLPLSMARAYARVVMRAMRDPTAEMCMVGVAWNSDARGIWTAMIDEALKE